MLDEDRSRRRPDSKLEIDRDELWLYLAAPEPQPRGWDAAVTASSSALNLQPLPVPGRPSSRRCVALALRTRSHREEQLRVLASFWQHLLEQLSNQAAPADELERALLGFVSHEPIDYLAGDADDPLAILALLEPGELLWTEQALGPLLEESGSHRWLEEIDRFSIAPRGWDVPQIAVRVLRAKLAAWSPRHARGQEGQHFVGRKRELDHFRRLFAELQRGRAPERRIQVLRGPAGLGKSATLRHVHDLADELGLSTVSTRCLDYATLRREGPVPSLLRSLLSRCHGLDDAGAEGLRAALDRLAEQLPFASRLFVVADLLDLPLRAHEQSALSHYTSQGLTALRGEVVLEWLVHCAGGRSLVVSIEDLHWADASLLALLEQLAKAAPNADTGAPLVIVASARPEADPSRTRATLAAATEVIQLSPLSAAEARALASELAETRRQPWQVATVDFVSDELIERCLVQAGGNPLFLTQLLRHALGASSARVSMSLPKLLAHRFASLSDRARQFVGCCACMGFDFDPDRVASLLGVDAEAALREATEGAVVRQAGRRWQFTHALLRDAVDESLSPHERRSYHLRLAESFADTPALQAEHLALAGHPSACSAFIVAATRRQEAFQLSESLALLERALATAPDPAARVEILRLQGSIFEQTGEGRQSLARFEHALAALDELEAADGPEASGERRATLRELLLGRLAAERLLGQLDAAAQTIATLHEQIASSPTEVSPLQRARFAYYQGCIAFAHGELERCEACHREAIEAIEAVDAAGRSDDDCVRVNAQASSGFGDALYAQGCFSRARTAMATCVELARQHRLGRTEVSTLTMLAIVNTYLGHTDVGMKLAREGYERAAQVGDSRATLLCELNMAMPLLWTARAPEGLVYCDSALERAAWIGSSVLTGMTHAFSAHVAVEGGERTRAEHSIGLALEVARKHGQRLFGGVAYGAALASSAAAPGDDRGRDARDDERSLDAGLALLESRPISHNYLYFALGAVPVLALRPDRARLAALCALLEGFFERELRDHATGCAASMVAWGTSILAWLDGRIEAQALQRRAQEWGTRGFSILARWTELLIARRSHELG